MKSTKSGAILGLFVATIMINTSFAAPQPGALLEAASGSYGTIVRLLGNERTAVEFRGFLTTLGVPADKIERSMHDAAYAHRLMLEDLRIKESDPAIRLKAVKMLGLDPQLAKTEVKAAPAVRTNGAAKSELSELLDLPTAKTINPSKSLTPAQLRAESAKSTRFADRVGGFADAGIIDVLVASELKVIAASNPERISSVVGDGFYSQCGKLKPLEARNYLTTVQAAIEKASVQEQALAMRSTFKRLTGASDARAAKEICKLSHGPCYLYASTGAAALNCR